jgi:uncharacterized repeat protein (TIGR03837 family)
MNRGLQWDIFCKVIDNLGDIGVCWRLASGLARRGQHVRLWADDASPLRFMAPGGCAGVQVLPWDEPLAIPPGLLQAHPPEVVVEAFGCNVAPVFIAACAYSVRAGGLKPLWINLEYLSAERYAERCHLLPSPMQAAPGMNWTKWFFYPGFGARTGGLLREPELPDAADFDRARWLEARQIAWRGEKLIALFCYEPAALAALLSRLASEGLCGQPARLLVTRGRAAAAVEQALAAGRQPLGQLSVSYLDWLSQHDFDCLLAACDLNFVRGEDSLVRAIWAGKPFVWQAYPQPDGAHAPKIDALLDVLEAPESLRVFHRDWNDDGRQAPSAAPPALALADWAACTAQARARLRMQDDLVTRLLAFAHHKREALA